MGAWLGRVNPATRDGAGLPVTASAMSHCPPPHTPERAKMDQEMDKNPTQNGAKDSS